MYGNAVYKEERNLHCAPRAVEAISVENSLAALKKAALGRAESPAFHRRRVKASARRHRRAADAASAKRVARAEVGSIPHPHPDPPPPPEPPPPPPLPLAVPVHAERSQMPCMFSKLQVS